VRIYEASNRIGGGARSSNLTLPGFTHDICSAVHPLTVSSPFFTKLDLARYGLEFIEPPAALAHPFDDGAASCSNDQSKPPVCNSVAMRNVIKS
jgi:phytoene dehydrogenase-like protein